MKDEEAIDWRERFLTFHWTRRISSRSGDRRFTKGSGSCVCFLEEKEENECVKNS